MAAKHTPGPWIVPDGGGRPAIYGGDETHIATLADTGDVMEANARLIAAAPGMFEALLAIAQFPMDPANRDMTFSQACAAMAELAHAALASANAP
jgi:hypothetical protein